MTDAAAHARIITDQAIKTGLTNLADDKVRYLLYKLTIKVIFDILTGSQDGSVDLDELTPEDLRDYKNGLEEIGASFYDLYSRGKVKGRGLEPNIIQPLIDQAGTKLTMAAKYKDKGDEERCLDKLKEGRFQLFHLVEHLKAVRLE